MKLFTRSRLAVGVVTVMAILVAYCVPIGNISRAYASNAPKGAATLFSVVRKISFGNYGPGASIAAVDGQSIFLTGTFLHGNSAPATLVRVDLQSFTVTARARLPSVTSVAYGDDALWWATGAPLGNAGTTLTPGHGRLLLKVDPTSLKVLARFVLPGPTLLVTVAQGNVWVATSTDLFRVNPKTGAIIAKVALGFSPVALAPSFNSAWLYALGGTARSHLILADYSAVSGHRLGIRQIADFSGGPLAVVRGGVWIPVQSTKTQSTTARLFKGRRFTPSSSVGKFTFDTQAYVEANILWLIDAGGRGPTVCANPANGIIRAKGSPVGVEYGAAAIDGGSTYLLRNTGTNESLLKIVASSDCSR